MCTFPKDRYLIPESAPGREAGPPGLEPVFDIVARVKALKNGNGLKYILNEAAVILKNPLLMCDMDGHLIACTENVITDDWLWNELVTTGTISAASLNFLRDESFLDEISGVRSIALLTSDKLKHSRLFGKLINSDGILVASLMMVAVNKPIDALDPVAFEAVCGLCTKEIRAIPGLLDYGRQYQQSLISTLLSRKAIDRGLYAVRAGNLYTGFASNLFVAVASAPRGIEAERLVRLREQLRKLMPDYKYAVYMGRIVILMSSNEAELSVKNDLPRLRKFLEQKDMLAGVSCGFENIFELRSHYAEAIKTLRAGKAGGERIFLCEHDRPLPDTGPTGWMSFSTFD